MILLIDKEETEPMKFNWNMTESDWKELKATQQKESGCDFFGNCWIGGICFDFQHTLDESDWYAFTNCFYVKENSSYGVLDDGTNYDLADGTPALPLRCKTFESFKKKCEEQFENYICKHDELKNLVNVEIKWYCCQ